MYRSIWDRGRLLWVVLAIWLFVVWLNFTDAVRVFDYRILSRTIQQTLEARSDLPIVLIATDANFVKQFGCPPYSQSTITRIESALASMGINELILPRGVESLFVSTNEISGKLIYTVPYMLFWDTYSKEWKIIPPPKTEKLKQATALSFLQFQEGGTVQRIPTPPSSIHTNLPVFPYYLALRMGADARTPKPNELIRFLGKSGSVPTLPLSRILNGEFSTKDVKGKISMFAITAGACADLLPVPADRMGMSYAEIMANAAITLHRPPITYMSNLLEWLIILLFILFGTLLLRRVKLGARMLLMLLLSVGWAAVAIASASFINVLIPFSMPLLALLLVFVYLNIEHTFSIVAALRENNLTLEKEVESFLFTPDILKDVPIESLFEQTIRHLRNFIELEKAYLFVLPEGRFHVRVAASIGCTEEEIRERRRDIRRRPWMDVISNPRGAYMQGFMKQKDELLAYGVPILDFGKLLGVMIVITNSDIELSPRQQKLLERTAFHLSGILHNYEHLFTNTNLAAAVINAIRNADAIKIQLNHTSRITNRVIGQIVKYRALLERVELGVAFADLMGIVYYTNASANIFLTNIGMAGKKDLLQILEHLSGSPQRAATMMERALAGEEVPSIEFEDKKNHKVYLIKLSALSVGTDPTEAESEGVSALQMTLFDITKNKQLDNLKSQAIYLASFKGKNIITGLSGFASLIKMQVEDPVVEEFSSELEDLTAQLAELFEEFATLAEKISVPPDEVVETPFDILATIGEIMEEVAVEARKKNVELIQNMPIMCAPVIGDWVRIKEGISLLLRDIVSSCFAGAQIRLTVKELEDGVAIEILDPSMTPTEQMLESAKNQQWDQLPSGMQAAFEAFHTAGIEFELTQSPEGGALIRLVLPKL